jgi:hypothetical protein
MTGKNNTRLESALRTRKTPTFHYPTLPPSQRGKADSGHFPPCGRGARWGDPRVPNPIVKRFRNSYLRGWIRTSRDKSADEP